MGWTLKLYLVVFLGLVVFEFFVCGAWCFFLVVFVIVSFYWCVFLSISLFFSVLFSVWNAMLFPYRFHPFPRWLLEGDWEFSSGSSWQLSTFLVSNGHFWPLVFMDPSTASKVKSGGLKSRPRFGYDRQRRIFETFAAIPRQRIWVSGCSLHQGGLFFGLCSRHSWSQRLNTWRPLLSLQVGGNGEVCYHNMAMAPDYGRMGHTEASGVGKGYRLSDSRCMGYICHN